MAANMTDDQRARLVRFLLAELTAFEGAAVAAGADQGQIAERRLTARRQLATELRQPGTR